MGFKPYYSLNTKYGVFGYFFSRITTMVKHNIKKTSLLLLIFNALLATGCPKNAPNLDLRDDNHKKLLVGQLKENVFKKEWIEYKCANDGYYNLGITAGTSFSTFTCGSNVVKNPDNAARIRNEVLDVGVGLIDSVYGVYIRDIRKNRSVGEFLADLLQIGGSTAGGIVNGERPLQVIGVALTGFSGVRKSASLNFYDEKTTSILIKRMDASRSQILSEIKQNQQKNTNYSFDAALDDIIRYFDAGTLNRAFTELDKQTSIEAEIARKGVLTVKNLKDISSLPTDEEIRANRTISTELAKLSNALKDETTAKPATAILKAVFDQVTKEDKFKGVLDKLKSKKLPEYDELNPKTKRNIESAFGKFGETPPKEVTGEEYHSLILAVLSMTNVQTEDGVVDKPELRKLLLDYIKKAELS